MQRWELDKAHFNVAQKMAAEGWEPFGAMGVVGGEPYIYLKRPTPMEFHVEIHPGDGGGHGSDEPE